MKNEMASSRMAFSQFREPRFTMTTPVLSSLFEVGLLPKYYCPHIYFELNQIYFKILKYFMILKC